MAEEDIIKEENTEEEKFRIPERKNIITLMKEWPLSRKVALAVVTALSLSIFAILIMQARTADYQLLYANLEQKDAAAVVSWLKGQRINYQLKNNGKNIWISANTLYETRLELASNGLPSGGGVGFEIFDKQSFALTDFVQKVNYTRALQGELARTITSLAPVEATRVHLVLPEKRLFKNQQKAATAAIIVNLKTGDTLEKDQVQGIIHLVSGSVEGLTQDNVTVIDNDGKVLIGNAKKDDEQRFSVDMLMFQQQIEQTMEERAQDLLDKTMGYGNAIVRVTASLDFAKVEKTEELFDADDPVIRSELLQEENNGSTTAGGIPGVESNLQGNTTTQGGGGPSSSKSSRTTNYEISKTVSKTINPIGTIKNLSVSVLLADKIIPAKDAESEPISETKSKKELLAVQTMVSSALGLDVNRGDVINVTSMPFMTSSDYQFLAETIPDNLLYEYLPLVKVGILFLGAFLFYFLLVRPIIKTMQNEVSDYDKSINELRQAAIKAKTDKEIANIKAEYEIHEEIIPDEVMVLRQEVMQNHIPTAYIIKNWINEG